MLLLILLKVVDLKSSYADYINVGDHIEADEEAGWKYW